MKDESPSNISWIGSINIFILLGGSLFGGPMFDRWGGKVIFDFVFAHDPLLTFIVGHMAPSYYIHIVRYDD